MEVREVIDAEVIANMVRPMMADSGRIAVIIVCDGPTRDEKGPFILSHEVATLCGDDQSVWPLAQVAQKWAEGILK